MRIAGWRHGFPARIEAYHHGIETAPFYPLTSSLDLVAKYRQLISAMRLNSEGIFQAFAESTRAGREVTQP